MHFVGLLEFRLVIGESEINNLDIFDALLISKLFETRGGGELIVPLLEHDHNVFGFEVSVDDLEGMQVDGGFDDLADDEGADVLG